MTTIISQSFLFHLNLVHELTVLCTRTPIFFTMRDIALQHDRIDRMIDRGSRSAWVCGVAVVRLTGTKATAGRIAC